MNRPLRCDDGVNKRVYVIAVQFAVGIHVRQAGIATVVLVLVVGSIDERRRAPKAGHDFLSVLLQAADESGTMSDRQLRDEAMTFYVGGYETTGTVLSWTLWQLASHPRILSQVQAELGQPDAPLLRACVQEGLRLYPAAPLIPRRAVADDTVGGVPIAAGEIVAVSPWLIRPRAFAGLAYTF